MDSQEGAGTGQEGARTGQEGASTSIAGGVDLDAAAAWFERRQLDEMILYKRLHPTRSFAQYIADLYPENSRVLEDGTLGCDERVMGPSWMGTWQTVRATDAETSGTEPGGVCPFIPPPSADLPPKLTDAQIAAIEERADGVNDKKSAIAALATIATFVAGFAAAELGQADLESFGDNTFAARLWLICMAFAVANAFSCAVLGIMIVFVVNAFGWRDRRDLRRWKSGELNDAYGEDGRPRDVNAAMLRAIGVQSPQTAEEAIELMPYAATFLFGVADYAQFTWCPPFVRCTWFCKSVLTFPTAILAYLVALFLVATKDADATIQGTVCFILTAFALPMVISSTRFVSMAFL